ncbi:MAG: hypothetical protein CSA97_02590 [Bacteroidetes bacterium]|nr:MAG: hypothetical protein CSA97_02590 [Bacteroidota bacterium]
MNTPEPKDLEARARDILARINLFQNGPVAQQLREAGVVYPYSLGVPIPSLREIAGEYEASMPLARHLVQRKLREAILIASMLAVPEEFQAEDYDLWEQTFTTPEAVEVACFHCLCKLPAPWSHISSWLQSQEPLRQKAGLLTLCHALRKGRTIPSTLSEGLELSQTAHHTALQQDLLALYDASQGKDEKVHQKVQAALRENLGPDCEL